MLNNAWYIELLDICSCHHTEASLIYLLLDINSPVLVRGGNGGELLTRTLEILLDHPALQIPLEEAVTARRFPGLELLGVRPLEPPPNGPLTDRPAVARRLIHRVIRIRDNSFGHLAIAMALHFPRPLETTAGASRLGVHAPLHTAALVRPFPQAIALIPINPGRVAPVPTPHTLEHSRAVAPGGSRFVRAALRVNALLMISDHPVLRALPTPVTKPRPLAVALERFLHPELLAVLHGLGARIVNNVLFLYWLALAFIVAGAEM